MLFEDNIKETPECELIKMGFGTLNMLSVKEGEIKFYDIYEECLNVRANKDIRQVLKGIKDKKLNWLDNKLFLHYGATTLFVNIRVSENVFEYNIHIDTATNSLMLNDFKEFYALILWELGIANQEVEITSRGQFWIEMDKKDKELDKFFSENYNFTNKVPRAEDVLSEEELEESLREHDEYDDHKSDKTIIARYEEFQKKRRILEK